MKRRTWIKLSIPVWIMLLIEVMYDIAAPYLYTTAALGTLMLCAAFLFGEPDDEPVSEYNQDIEVCP